MNSIINHIKTKILLALLCIAFTACNKENLEAEKAFHVLVNGYNGSGNALEITIDTTKFGGNNYIIKPVSLIGFGAAYTYHSQGEKSLIITDMVTKKILFSKLLPETGTI